MVRILCSLILAVVLSPVSPAHGGQEPIPRQFFAPSAHSTPGEVEDRTREGEGFPKGLRPCVNEEREEVGCYWDASSRGNHMGDDYWMGEEGFTYYRWISSPMTGQCWKTDDDGPSIVWCDNGGEVGSLNG